MFGRDNLRTKVNVLGLFPEARKFSVTKASNAVLPVRGDPVKPLERVTER
jgi:hypothetical protein